MRSEIQNRLAKNLKCLRKAKKLTQFELAERANISEAMVKSIELSLAWPSDKTLAQLSEALEADVFKFFLPTDVDGQICKGVSAELREVARRNYNAYLVRVFPEVEIKESK